MANGFPVNLQGFHDLRKKIGKSSFTGKLLALDPGETTGFSLFQAGPDNTSLLLAGQMKTWPLESGLPQFNYFFHRPNDEIDTPNRLDFVVYEKYHIYQWKLDEHTFAEVPTIQVIGMIRTLCIQQDIPYTYQTAQVGKGFCTDQKLKEWGLWITGLIHARDSIRHGCHRLLFQPQ